MAVSDCNAEEWRLVPGLPYEVSDRGSVRRATPGHCTYAGRMNRPFRGNGYLRVELSPEVGRKKKYPVHRLVAAAFLPTAMPGRAYINHKNGDRADNRPENLEWVSAKENTADSVRRLGGSWSTIGPRTRGEAHPKAKLTEEDAVAIREAVALRCNQRILAEIFGVSIATIESVVSRRTWKHV